MAELGKAYIEVRADLAKFPAELRTKLMGALKTAVKDVSFTELENKAEKAGEAAAEKAGKGFAKKGEQALKKGAEKAGKGLLDKLVSFFDSRRGNDSGSMFGAISGAISGGIADGLKAGGQLFENASKVFSKIGDIGGTIGSILQVGALITLIPVILGVAGALVQLGAALFALPALAGVAVAGIAPLVIAFQGIGEAIGAGLSGDTEKFKEALKGLAPAAQKVVKEFVTLGPMLKSIKATVQQAFFAPLVGQVKQLGVLLLPMLRNGLALVAKQLGTFGAELITLLSSNDVVADINQLFASTARIIKDLTGPAIELFGNLFGIMEKGLPFVEDFFHAISGGLKTAAGFLSKIQQNGQLTEWLGKAKDAATGLWDTIKNATAAVLTFFSGEIGDAGRQFIHEFADEFKRLNEFLQTDKGRESLHNLATLTTAFGKVLNFLVGSIEQSLLVLNFMFRAVKQLGAALQALGGGFVWLISKIGQFAVWLGKGIGHAFHVAYDAVVGFFVDLGKAIGSFFTDTIPRWFDQVVSFFAGLPDKVLGALKDLQTRGRNFLIEMLTDWYKTVLFNIGRAIGIILSLPQILSAAWDLGWKRFTDTIQAGWDFVVAVFQGGIDAVVYVVNSIPGWFEAAGAAIWGFLQNLGTSIADFFTVTIPAVLSAAGEFIWQLMKDIWQRVVVDSYNWIVDGFNKALDFVNSIAGRIEALGPRILDAARGIGRKIAQGLSEIGDFATDLGRKVVNALKGGINWAIDQINSGIADIDNSLPGSLPRLPRLANGDVVDRPTLAVVGEAGPEVVIPLTNAQRAQQLAKESGLVNLLKMGRPAGAVQVTVYLDPSGVIIPTVRTVVDGTLDDQGDELAYGTREA